MKKSTNIRTALRLIQHVEDLQALHHFTQQEVIFLQERLIQFIAREHRLLSNGEHLSACVPGRTYVLYHRSGAPNQISVHEPGLSDRVLKHIPIFSFSGFDLYGLAALDAALALLADVFDETLTKRGFIEGQARYCQHYRAFAQQVLAHLDTSGIIHQTCIQAFLNAQSKR